MRDRTGGMKMRSAANRRGREGMEWKGHTGRGRGVTGVGLCLSKVVVGWWVGRERQRQHRARNPLHNKKRHHDNGTRRVSQSEGRLLIFRDREALRREERRRTRRTECGKQEAEERRFIASHARQILVLHRRTRTHTLVVGVVEMCVAVGWTSARPSQNPNLPRRRGCAAQSQ